MKDESEAAYIQHPSFFILHFSSLIPCTVLACNLDAGSLSWTGASHCPASVVFSLFPADRSRGAALSLSVFFVV
jgi:hypothetical protein